MTKLSKYEKETIINWNEAEDTASIYTFNADLKRRLAEFSRKYPQLCWLERSALLGSRGKAHWRVEGSQPHRVKGETPCPGRVDALRQLILGIT